MSDREIGSDPKARETVGFLATVPLLEGIPESELADLAGLLSRRELPAGDVLWHEGDEAMGMVLIVNGRVSLSLRLPADRTIEFASLGAGEVLGEVPLLDGGHHSATARALVPASLLWLSRADFTALVARRHSTAFALKRRIAEVACGRLRMRLATLAASRPWVEFPRMRRRPRRRRTSPTSNPPGHQTARTWRVSPPSTRLTRSRSGGS
jgi:CRP/FNR family cyclic AMP-dependent transcriptional regulator